MPKQTRLCQAIAFALASAGTAGVSGIAVAQQEGEQQRSRRVIEEVVVTATKREERMQDIPITLQTLGAQELENLDINNFADYVKQLPNVTFAGRGPGQNDVFIRGIAVGRGSLFQSGGIGAGPSVAFYVDEAPLTSAGRNIDIYVTDIARVEVLPGPQGTLYGASSQAGTVRLITNKPDLSGFSSSIELSLSATQDGEESWGVEGFLNVPVVDDRFAVRLAAYNVKYGGYIDNVPGTMSFDINPAIMDGSLPLAPDAELRESTNEQLVQDDFNDSTYTGARIMAMAVLSDNWDLTVGYMTQELDTDGVFDYSPEIGDLEVTRFTDDYLDDEFDQFNWTLEGRVGALDVVYAGSFLNRKVDQRIDYVGSTVLSFMPFYNCTYNSVGEITLCAAPDQNFHGIQRSDDTQHELRFSTDPGNSVRFTGGVYYDKSEGGVSQEWEYHSPHIDGIDFAPNAPHSEATHFNPETRDPEVAFFNDLSNEAEQIAFFGELSYDFTEAWSATLGLRYYDIDIVPRGSFNFATMGNVDTNSGGALDNFDPANDSDTIAKFTLTYTPNDDLLLYATLSEGFRRGGFNRGGDVFNIVTGELAFPASYTSDTIDNYELGWKAMLADGRLRFNGSAYFIYWSDMQIDIFDPDQFGLLLFTANVGEAEVRGLEGDLTWLATDNLSLSGAFSLNDTELTSRPSAADNLLPVGSDLALTPTFQGNLNIRYDFRLRDMDAYVQLSGQHRGDTFTTIDVGGREGLDSYMMGDVSFGLSMDEWNLRVFVNNFTDERSELFISSQDAFTRTVTARPRTLSVKLSREF